MPHARLMMGWGVVEGAGGGSRIVNPNDLLRNLGTGTQFTEERALRGRGGNWAENALSLGLGARGSLLAREEARALQLQGRAARVFRRKRRRLGDPGPGSALGGEGAPAAPRPPSDPSLQLGPGLSRLGALACALEALFPPRASVSRRSLADSSKSTPSPIRSCRDVRICPRVRVGV